MTVLPQTEHWEERSLQQQVVAEQLTVLTSEGLSSQGALTEAAVLKEVAVFLEPLL